MGSEWLTVSACTTSASSRRQSEGQPQPLGRHQQQPQNKAARGPQIRDIAGCAASDAWTARRAQSRPRPPRRKLARHRASVAINSARRARDRHPR